MKSNRVVPIGTCGHTKRLAARIKAESGRTITLCKEPSLFPQLSSVKIGD